MPRQYGPSKTELRARESTAPNELAELSGHRSSFVRSAVARNPHTRQETLARLALSDDKYVRQAVASNPNTPGEALLRLARDTDAYVCRVVAKNPSLPTPGLLALAHSGDRDAAAEVAANPLTPVDEVVTLSRHSDARVRAGVAVNPEAPEDILVMLTTDSSPDVARALAGRNRHLNSRSKVIVSHRRGWRGESVEVPVEDGGRFSPALIAAFSVSSHPLLHKVAASQPDAAEVVLEHLAGHEDLWVRVRVAENPGATERVLLAVLSRPGPEVFQAVAKREGPLPLAVVEAIACSRVATAHALLGVQGAAALLTSPDPAVRARATKCVQATDVPVLSQMLDDDDEQVQVAAAKAITKDVLDLFTHLSSPKVLAVIAERTDSPAALRSLAEHPHWSVRWRVACNPSTELDVFTTLAQDPNAKVRAEAAERFMRAFAR